MKANRAPRAEAEIIKEGSAQECLLGIFNGAELLEMDLPEVQWAVPRLLPQGLAILAGGPKLGKSWLIYSLCAGIGAGCPVLGYFPTPKAKCLYLALEDSKKRLQNRLKALCLNEPDFMAGLENVDFQTTWPRFDSEGGLEKLETYCEMNAPKGLKLVVIDTLAKVGPKSKNKSLNAYESDSITMSRIKALADKNGICILIATHLSKLRVSNDPFDSITGSMGQFGTADTAMLLLRARGAEKAKLLTTGRDIDGETYGLRWTKPGWTCTGIDEGATNDLTQERQTILQVFQNNSDPMSPAMVASATGKTPKTASYHINKLKEDGFLISDGYGRYRSAGSARSTGSVGSVVSSIDEG